MSAFDAEVAALTALDLGDLREAWRARYGAPPRLRSADLLRRRLAWRIQAEVLGGLDAQTLQALRVRSSSAAAAGPQRAPGTRLVREHKGERHEVTISEDGGVTYRGERFASLSEVARAITGVRWNGPRFFGLRGGA